MNMKEFAISTNQDENLSPTELAEFFFLFKATYVAAVDFCEKNRIDNIDQRDAGRLQSEFNLYLKKLTAIELDDLFTRNLGGKNLATTRISRSSPWEYIVCGLVTASVLAAIVSGGEVSFVGLFSCKLNAIGDGIRKLKTGLGIGKKTSVGYCVQSTKIKLSKTEYAELKKQDPNKKSRGGFQSFLVNLQNRINKSTLEIELNQSDLKRIAKYKAQPKAGGFQARFLKIFGRHFPKAD